MKEIKGPKSVIAPTAMKMRQGKISILTPMYRKSKRPGSMWLPAAS